MVISPEGMERSVYVVRVEHLADSLSSLASNDVHLEHIFDF
jgi:hypothetical protein